MTTQTTIVVPTLLRGSLATLLDALAEQSRPLDAPVVLVDDRPSNRPAPVPATTVPVRLVRTGGGGPARARNIGWRHARTPWVSFLDDDVVPEQEWYADLLSDLARAEDTGAVGTQGRLHVPLPLHRRPNDWERSTASLETARWITADLSYRRDALARVGGFDERFPRAFREDADLALRLGADRGTVLAGTRRVTHPVRPSDCWASVRAQAGNADDMLMRRLHGRGWHRRAGAPVGRRAAHIATTGAAAAALAGVVAGRWRLAGVGALGWLLGTADLARHRITPGPRDREEVRRMLLTSAAIPPVATWHILRGLRRHRYAPAWRGQPELVLLDRDGTLVTDVPYNRDPDLVQPLPGARGALDRLRREGIRLAVVTNQSGIGRGLITPEEADAVDARVAELLGPFEAVHRCPHTPEEGCDCRKPASGLVRRALSDSGVAPDRTVLIGDIVSDIEAARAAGVSAILVPTDATDPEHPAATAGVPTAATLTDAVAMILGGAW